MLNRMTAGTAKLGIKNKKNNLPHFCDFSCPHAEFTQQDTSGACRRDIAVFCTLYKRHNNKNSTCIEKKK